MRRRFSTTGESRVREFGMLIVREMKEIPDSVRHGSVSVGNFDGVHRGHSAILRRLLSHAHEVGGPAVVFTFHPHPLAVLRPDRAPPCLMSLDRKLALFEDMGIEAIVVNPTNRSFLHLSAKEFLDRVLVAGLEAKAVVEGPNFFFGIGREGSIDTLSRFCRGRGITIEIVQPERDHGEIISSSRIRCALADGNVEAAARMLGRPHRVRGRIVHGHGRGAGLEFPTANLIEIDCMIPANGIYAGKAHLDRESFSAAIHVGPNVTFGESEWSFEVHLLDFTGRVYGERLDVEFLARLRDSVRFETVEELKVAIAEDCERVRRIVEATQPAN